MAFLGESLWIAGLQFWEGMVDLWKWDRGGRERGGVGVGVGGSGGLRTQMKTFCLFNGENNIKDNGAKK